MSTSMSVYTPISLDHTLRPQERIPGRKRKQPDSRDDDCTHEFIRKPAPSFSDDASMEQDSRIWFPDGDVILKAEDGNVGFRVYREVLERESSVFKDIFAKSLPGARKMADDGCPVLDTTDRIHELRVFLDTLLCGADQYYLGDDPVAIDWEELSTLIQMGEKYGVRDLVETGIARLKKYYPTTLDTWDHLTRRRMSVNFPIRAAPRVLALAELTNTPTLLPGAYLDCCALATMTTYDLKFPKDGDDKADEPVYVNDLDVLAPAERARVMAAAERLATARTARMLAVHRAVPCEFCTRPERCALSAQRTMQEIELSTLRENARGRNLFEPVFEYFREGFEEYTMCEPCEATAGQVDIQTRFVTWCELPKIFDIEVEGWPDSVNAAMTMEG